MLTARTIPILAASVLAGAAHAQFGTVNGSGLMGQGVRFQSVATGSQANMDQPGLYQFRDEATLRNHWARFGLRGPLPAKVNWTADQVVLIHLGRRNTGGYSVTLGAVEKKADGRVRITAVEQTPLKDEITTQALTSPYLAIAIDNTLPSFELAWTRRAGNGIGPTGNLPPGSTVFTYPGGTVIVNPRIGPCDVWGGDYYSLCSAPGEFWIGSDAELARYSFQVFGDRNAIRPTFDWRSERLLAVHLGTQAKAVSIETVSFQQKGDRGTLWLAQAPARTAIQRGKPISPFLLLRVARDVRRVDVNWAKRDK